jgi:hypothetical protein
MTIQFRAIHSVLLAIVFILCGCSAAFDLAITGAGQAAKVENIKFFTSTTELKPRSRADLPDYYYVSSNYSSSKYKIVIINDFTSITSDISHISGLQVPAFKNLRVDIPDNIAQSLDGSVFSKCIRSSKRIDHLDINDIKRCKGDAILFGNISRIRSGLRAEDGHVGLTNTQVEIKIVDRKTGEETIKMIMRNSTDGDKVIMPIVRQLSNLINVAKDYGKKKTGKTIIIKDKDGNTYTYGHLDKIEVKKKDEVTTDTEIGKIGKTGNVIPIGKSDGSHLHFEKRDNKGNLVHP